MKIRITIGLCLVLLTASAQQRRVKQAPVLEEISPNAVGMSPDRLQRIDVMIQEQIDRGAIPGSVALVARNGKIVYHKAFGKADANSGALLRKDHIFRLASQTKAITSTAVMMLWEEGKFRLDDPISKYIPAFKNMKVLETFSLSDTSFTTRPASKEITIRHLLTHTSGIGYGMIDPDERMRMIYTKGKAVDAFTTNDVSIETFVNNIAKLPLHFNTQYYADPKENVIGILLKQTVGSSGDETGWKFQQLVGAAIDD